MAEVFFDLVRPGDDTPAKEGTIVVELVGGDRRRINGTLEDGTVVVGTFTPQVDANGHASVDLVPNSLIEPAGTVYKVAITVDDERTVDAIEVLDIGTPRSWTTLITEFPGEPLPNTALLAHIESATAHPAASITLDTPAGMTADDVQGGVEELLAQIGSLDESFLDAVETEADLREAADVANAAAINAEATARANADTTLTDAITAETAAREAADAQLVPQTELGVTVATIDPLTGKIYASQIPPQSVLDITIVDDEAAMLALDASVDDIAIRRDNGIWYKLNALPASTLGNWEDIPTAVGVSAVNGRTGAVTGLAEQSDLNAEATARATADTAEATARANADTTEATARATADALRLEKAQNLADLASAAAARTNLGLGTAAVASGSDFAPATPAVGTGLATTGAQVLDMAALNGTYQSISMTGNMTFTSSNRSAGRQVTLVFEAGAASRSLSFPSWRFVGNEAPSVLTAGKVGVLTVVFRDATDAAAVAAWAVEA